MNLGSPQAAAPVLGFRAARAGAAVFPAYILGIVTRPVRAEYGAGIAPRLFGVIGGLLNSGFGIANNVSESALSVIRAFQGEIRTVVRARLSAVLGP